MRAPPITPLILRAIIAAAVFDNQIAFATLLALGFHALLRTGELLSLCFKDVEFSQNCGVLTLRQTKSGQRTGSQEAVALRDRLSLQLLDTLVALTPHSPGSPLWPHSAQRFRELFRLYQSLLHVEHLQFKPYSLRRGGATYLLQCGIPLEAILVKGRWKSLAVARLYLQDGMAMIPSLRLSSSTSQLVSTWAAATPSTAFQP